MSVANPDAPLSERRRSEMKGPFRLSLLLQAGGFGFRFGQEVLQHPDFGFVRLPAGENQLSPTGMNTQVAQAIQGQPQFLGFAAFGGDSP